MHHHARLCYPSGESLVLLQQAAHCEFVWCFLVTVVQVPRAQPLQAFHPEVINIPVQLNTTVPGTSKGQKRESDSLGAELQTVLSWHVDAGN